MSLARQLPRLLVALLVAALCLATPGVAQGAAKPQRTISSRAVEPKPQAFFIKGAVSDGYARKKIYVERRVGGAGDWRVVRTEKTTGLSRFKVRIFRFRESRKTCWRVRVPGRNDFRGAKTDAVCLLKA